MIRNSKLYRVFSPSLSISIILFYTSVRLDEKHTNKGKRFLRNNRTVLRYGANIDHREFDKLDVGCFDICLDVRQRDVPRAKRVSKIGSTR